MLKTLERFACLFFSAHGRCAVKLDTLTTMNRISINKVTMRMFIFVYLKADPVAYSNASTDFAWTHVTSEVSGLRWLTSPLPGWKKQLSGCLLEKLTFPHFQTEVGKWRLNLNCRKWRQDETSETRSSVIWWQSGRLAAVSVWDWRVPVIVRQLSCLSQKYTKTCVTSRNSE